MRNKLLVAGLLVASFAGGAAAQMVPNMGILQAAAAILLGGNDVIQFTGNKAYSSASGPSNSWLWSNGVTINGQAQAGANGFISPYQIYIGSDTVDTTTSGSGALTAFMVEHASAVGHTGIREAIKGYEAIVGADPTGVSHAHVGVTGITRASANMGGTTGAYQNYIGNAFGGNSNVFSTANATFLQVFNAHEFDVALVSGSSAAEKHAMTIIQSPNDAVRGTYDDSALEFANAGSSSWATVVSIGSATGGWPAASDSTLFGAVQRTIGGTSNPVAMYGFDVSAVTFSPGGAPILSSLITPASSSATCKQGAMAWDASFIYVCGTTNSWRRTALSTF